MALLNYLVCNYFVSHQSTCKYTHAYVIQIIIRGITTTIIMRSNDILKAIIYMYMYMYTCRYMHVCHAWRLINVHVIDTDNTLEKEKTFWCLQSYSSFIWVLFHFKSVSVQWSRLVKRLLFWLSKCHIAKIHMYMYIGLETT